jgi:hypothetical protein
MKRQKRDLDKVPLRKRMRSPGERLLRARMVEALVPSQPRPSGRFDYLMQLSRFTVGPTPHERLRWLVERFANTTKDGVVEGEMAAFALFEGGRCSSGLMGLPGADVFTSVEFKDLRETVAKGLERIVNGREWIVQMSDPVDRSLRRPVAQDEIQGRWYVRAKSQRRAVRAAFLLAATSLLEREGRWLARCKRCKRPYARADVRQLYCSTTCSQAVRTAKFRNKAAGKAPAVRRRTHASTATKPQ